MGGICRMCERAKKCTQLFVSKAEGKTLLEGFRRRSEDKMKEYTKQLRTTFIWIKREASFGVSEDDNELSTFIKARTFGDQQQGFLRNYSPNITKENQNQLFKGLVLFYCEIKVNYFGQ
jgi:hypothetical protein